MAVDHVKDGYITNLDATPRIVPTSGKGAAGFLKNVEGSALAVASSSVGATYQLARVPWTAKIKRVVFESAAQGAGAFNVGVYHATDGSVAGAASSLLVADAIDADLFASAIDCASAVARTDITNESGNYTIDKRDMPLWEAAGLTSNPGGNADIVATVNTTAVTTGTGRLGISVDYID